MKSFIRTTIFTLILTSLINLGFGINNNQAIASVLGVEQLQFAQISQNHSQNIPQVIADKILAAASAESGVAIPQLKITQVQSQTFSNPCRFNFGEICTQEYNPVKGWVVIVKVENQSWTYHVNQSSSQIVLDPQVKTD